MSEFNISIESGTSKRLPIGNKWSEKDIIVTATGGKEDLNDVLTEQDALIEELKEVLRGKASVTPTPTQEKTIDITENGTHTVTPDEGYALSKVTANVNVPIPDGYIKPSGTKDITSNGTHSVTEYDSVSVDVPIPDGYIVPSGTLEVAENGTHDVTEYASVNVNVEASGGGNEIEDAILSNKIAGDYANDRITYLGGYHFLLSANLTSVSFPNVTSTGTNPFQQATKLANVSMPKLTRAANYMVYGCSALPKLDLPSLSGIGAAAFQACTSLTTLILRRTTLCKLDNTNALTRTPIADGTGYIYVPKALVEDYKVATNWANYASQFRAIEDYPEICGG